MKRTRRYPIPGVRQARAALAEGLTKEECIAREWAAYKEIEGTAVIMNGPKAAMRVIRRAADIVYGTESAE